MPSSAAEISLHHSVADWRATEKKSWSVKREEKRARNLVDMDALPLLSPYSKSRSREITRSQQQQKDARGEGEKWNSQYPPYDIYTAAERWEEGRSKNAGWKNMPGRKAARRSPTPKYLPHRRRKNNRYGRRPLLFFFLGSLRPHVTNAPPGEAMKERRTLGLKEKAWFIKRKKGEKSLFGSTSFCALNGSGIAAACPNRLACMYSTVGEEDRPGILFHKTSREKKNCLVFVFHFSDPSDFCATLSP